MDRQSVMAHEIDRRCGVMGTVRSVAGWDEAHAQYMYTKLHVQLFHKKYVYQ